MTRAIWITWERQRRNPELAGAFDVPLHVIEGGRNRLLRYIRVVTKTVWLLVSTRPQIVFAQNPSIVLAALVCLLRWPLGFLAVIDRHSNFDFDDTESGLGNKISNFSLRHADLTIVTNAFLKSLVEAKGGRAFVLPDRMPTLHPGAPPQFSHRYNVVFVCTYKDDEPVAEVIEAARLLPPDVCIHVTGNDRRLPSDLRSRLSPGVRLTGFLQTADYESLLAHANLVLELTTRDHTLLCGAYEATSVGTPLVISRTEALTAYFQRGVVRTENTAPAIAAAIKDGLDRENVLREELTSFRTQLVRDWDSSFQELQARILTAARDRGAS